MGMLFLIIGAAVFVGCGLATLVLGIAMYKGNKMGDSKGSFGHFAKTDMHVIQQG